MFFVPVQEQFAENTNRSYRVCRVIVFYIFIIKCLVSDKHDHLETKINV